MLRTLQTATCALDWLFQRGVVFEASADWQGAWPGRARRRRVLADLARPQENLTKPCDTGSPAAALAPAFPHVDFSRLDTVWPDKTSPRARRYAHSRAAVLARAAHALDALARRPESLVFVVSHSGFLRSGVTGYWFFNADYRVFRFQGADQDVDSPDAVTAPPARALRQDETTFAGGLGLSYAFPVELGADLPGEDSDLQ